MLDAALPVEQRQWPEGTSVTMAIGSYDGEVEVCVAFSRPMSLALQERATSTLAAYAAGLEAGLFAHGQRTTIAQAALTFDPGTIGGTATFSLRQGGAQDGAYRVLLNMLEGIDARSPDPVSIVVTTRPLVGDTRAIRGVASLPFPSGSVDPPFGVLIKNRFHLSQDVLVRLDMAVDVDTETLSRIASLLEAWDGVVARGGFFPDPIARGIVEDADELKQSAQTYRASPHVIEHLLYQPAGSSAAYNALLNVVAHIDRRIGRVNQIDVE